MKPYVIQNFPAVPTFTRNAEADTLHEALQTAASLLETCEARVRVFMRNDDNEYQMTPVAEMRFLDLP